MKNLPLIVPVALALCGCEPGQFDPNGLIAPSPRLMAKKCMLPKAPESDGDPVARADYEAKLRTCASRRGGQVDGLQAYARKVSSK